MGLVVVPSLAFVLGSSLLAMYGTYLEFVLFSTEVSWTLKDRGLGCFERALPFFLSTTSSASMWMTTRSRTLKNVYVGFMIN